MTLATLLRQFDMGSVRLKLQLRLAFDINMLLKILPADAGTVTKRRQLVVGVLEKGRLPGLLPIHPTKIGMPTNFNRRHQKSFFKRFKLRVYEQEKRRVTSWQWSSEEQGCKANESHPDRANWRPRKKIDRP